MASLRTLAVLSLASRVWADNAGDSCPTTPLPCPESTLHIPNAPYDGAPTSVELTSPSTLCSLDFQKVLPYPNATGYEWWYFDVVNLDNANEVANVVFMQQGQYGFQGGPEGQLLTMEGQFGFANGSTTDFIVAATGATIKQGQEGIEGVWEGTGFSFKGSPLDISPRYSIEIDSKELDIKGTITMRGIAPPHYPCSGNVGGQTEIMLPHVGWSNVMPDALTTVDLTIKGTELKFEGTGYHDKNWGDGAPFAAVVKHWYWGHARVGPYSVVFFDAVNKDGEEYFSGYVSKEGNILEASCGNGSVLVRPYGKNDEYPPPVGGQPSDGLTATFDLGAEGTLQVNVTTQNVLVNMTNYRHCSGQAFGGVVGGPQFKGSGFYETFMLG